jgi:hypothetical protein
VTVPRSIAGATCARTHPTRSNSIDGIPRRRRIMRL